VAEVEQCWSFTELSYAHSYNYSMRKTKEATKKWHNTALQMQRGQPKYVKNVQHNTQIQHLTICDLCEISNSKHYLAISIKKTYIKTISVRGTRPVM